MHPVVTERQIVRQHEAGFANRTSVEVKRCGEVVDLAYSVADGAVLKPQPYVGRLTMGDMNPERRRGAGSPENGRRQCAGPVPAVVSGLRRAALRLGRRGDTERGEDRYQRALRDFDPATAPVLVLGSDPEVARQFGQ